VGQLERGVGRIRFAYRREDLFRSFTVNYESHIQVKAKPHGQYCVEPNQGECEGLRMGCSSFRTLWRLINSRKLTPNFRTDDRDDLLNNGLT
jgi:hypothetical protein